MKYVLCSLIFLSSIIPLLLFIDVKEELKEQEAVNKVLLSKIENTEKEIRLIKTDIQVKGGIW